MSKSSRDLRPRGVPLRLLVDKFSRTRFEPYGFTENPSVPEVMERARADLVTLHVPLVDATRHLVNARNIGLMRPGDAVGPGCCSACSSSRT